MWQLSEPQARFFTDEQRRWLEVLLEAILPGGPNNPGARDAQAVEYVDRLLAMDETTYYEIKTWKAQYAEGLAFLAAACAARFGGRGIDTLASPEATQLLSVLAAGQLGGVLNATDQKSLFAVLRNHCIEGCFADRRWGGNRDAIIWRWYGYPTGPSGEVTRDPSGAAVLVNANPPPARAADPSANTGTAVKDPSEIQSATVLPDILAQAIALNRP